MIIKLVYTLFLALLIALFIGLGIDAFYPGPTPPEYPIEIENIKPTSEEETRELNENQKKFNQEQKVYFDESKSYNRNVSMISLAASIIVLVASLTLLSKIKMIADGILLGGVFTAAYSIIRGLMSNDSRFRFLIVTVGLIIALVLGYIKFIKGKKVEQEL